MRTEYLFSNKGVQDAMYCLGEYLLPLMLCQVPYVIYTVLFRFLTDKTEDDKAEDFAQLAAVSFSGLIL